MNPWAVHMCRGFYLITEDCFSKESHLTVTFPECAFSHACRIRTGGGETAGCAHTFSLLFEYRGKPPLGEPLKARRHVVGSNKLTFLRGNGEPARCGELLLVKK